MVVRVVVPQLSLQCVRPQEGVSHEGAGQAARGDVLAELKAEEVPVRSKGAKGRNNELGLQHLYPCILISLLENKHTTEALFTSPAKRVFCNEKPALLLGTPKLVAYLQKMSLESKVIEWKF